MSDFQRGLDRFIKEANLNEEQAQTVREGLKDADPTQFGDWVEKQAFPGQAAIGKAAPWVVAGDTALKFINNLRGNPVRPDAPAPTLPAGAGPAAAGSMATGGVQAAASPGAPPPAQPGFLDNPLVPMLGIPAGLMGLASLTDDKKEE